MLPSQMVAGWLRMIVRACETMLQTADDLSLIPNLPGEAECLLEVAVHHGTLAPSLSYVFSDKFFKK